MKNKILPIVAALLSVSAASYFLINILISKFETEELFNIDTDEEDF